MKSVKILLSVALAVVGVVAMAQDFSDDAKYGKYGATPEERKDNIYLLNFFNEAVGNQDFQTASGIPQTTAGQVSQGFGEYLCQGRYGDEEQDRAC